MAGVVLLHRYLAIDCVCTHKKSMRIRWLADLASFQIDYNEQTQRYCVGSQQLSRSFCVMGCIMKMSPSTTAGKRVWPSTRYAFFLLLSRGRTSISPIDTTLFDPVQEEAVTDALKRILRNFANLLANCLYDKEYAKVCLRPLSVTWYPFLTNPTRKWSRFKYRHQHSTGPSSRAFRSPYRQYFRYWSVEHWT